MSNETTANVDSKREAALVELFVEERKKVAVQRASRKICDARIKGPDKKREARRFRKTKEYEELLDAELSKDDEWKILNGDDPISNPSQRKIFESKRERLERELDETLERERIARKRTVAGTEMARTRLRNKPSEAIKATRADLRQILKEFLSTERIRLKTGEPTITGRGRNRKTEWSFEELDADNVKRLFVRPYTKEIVDVNVLYGYEPPSASDMAAKRLLDLVPTFRKYADDEETADLAFATAKRAVDDILNQSGGRSPRFPTTFVKFPAKDACGIMKRNPNLADMYEVLDRKERLEELISDEISDRIPERYADLYPLAREIKRKFTIHSGPTNSGKTYDAMQKLMAADTGAYFGPLRLLAFEQFEKMNAAGVWCSLITGEERIEVPDGTHESCTVEIADFEKEYDVAVIDEAQMLGDPFRGGSWTAAILGIRAKEVEVCCAPHAVELVKELIRQCGDEYVVKRHERKTPLIAERSAFRFPDDVEKGDALIAFSKRSVHAIASELQKNGWKCSVVYGSLPYDVRRREAEKFDAKKTDVVVATDAIGMGINLPIRRVVFLETEKFDGRIVRGLYDEEIRQIAGRAGRLGRFPKGFVTSEHDRRTIRKALSSTSEDLVEAVMPFPKSLVEIDAPLSDVMKKWDAMPLRVGFRKADLSIKTKLCEWCETVTDDKNLIYDMITIPFDERNETVAGTWRAMVEAEAGGSRFPAIEAIPTVGKDEKLEDLELKHKICDLLWSYCDRFLDEEATNEVMKAKRRASDGITEILAKQRLEGKKCKICGRRLGFTYKYGICESCFAESRGYW